jgi:hypothetical protein
MLQQASAQAFSFKKALAKVICNVCGGPAFVVTPTNKIESIHVGHSCKCRSSGGSVLCMSCYQRQTHRRKTYNKQMSWVVCNICNCYIKSSSKDFFHRGEGVDLANALVTQAWFRFDFPQGCGSIQANGQLIEFFETFKSLRRDAITYEHFVAIVFPALFAQLSRPRVFPMPQKWFFSKRIDRRMRCLSMTRKFFFKLMGISCESYIFNLGYTNPEFSHIYCGFFLRFIIKRILARFYLLQ